MLLCWRFTLQKYFAIIINTAIHVISTNSVITLVNDVDNGDDGLAVDGPTIIIVTKKKKDGQLLSLLIRKTITDS